MRPILANVQRASPGTGRKRLTPRSGAVHFEIRLSHGTRRLQQVRQLLGFATRMQVDPFLQQHQIYDYTVEDLDKDMATLEGLRATKAE